jgi:hypothetical protein
MYDQEMSKTLNIVLIHVTYKVRPATNTFKGDYKKRYIAIRKQILQNLAQHKHLYEKV